MVKINKTSRYRKYRDGLWLKSRYALYMWWFKYLRLATQEGRKVDWSKYDGWGGPDQVLTQRFETWWAQHWKDLFAVENEGDAATFEITSRKTRAEAVRVAYLVYTNRHIGNDEQIYTYLQSRYKNLLSLDEDKVLETKYVNQHVKRYRMRAEQLLKDVCDGKFG